MSEPQSANHDDDLLRDRVSELALRRVFGDLSPEESTELERLVCDNQRARSWYVDAMIEAAALHYHAAGVTTPHERSGVLAASLSAPDAATPDAATATAAASQPDLAAVLPLVPSAPPTVLGFLGSSVRSIASFGGSFSPLMLVAAAITASLFWLAIAHWVIPLWHQSQQIAATPASHRVGKLVAAKDCQWRRQVALEPGTDLSREPLEIVSGYAEFELASGTQIIVQGPARLQCETPSRLRLDHGRLVASVPQSDIGFTVVTPAAEVIDLGTEFGVEVDANGETEVHTLKGQVAVKPARPLGTPAQKAVAKKGIQVSAGEAVRVESSGNSAATVPFNGERFAQSRSQTASRLAASSSIALGRIADASNDATPDEKTTAVGPFSGAIPLGNLFDDVRSTDLALAIASDGFRAVPELGDLGVERVLYGGEPVKQICPRVRFNLKALGWENLRFGQVANDAWADSDTVGGTNLLGGIRTQGAKISQTAPRFEDGLSTHANSLITFDLDEIRAAGHMPRRDLTFICDAAGQNDSAIGEHGTLHMAVIACDRSGVVVALVDGRSATVKQVGGVWQFESPVDQPIRGDGQMFSVRLPLGPEVRYLTLGAASAGDGHGCDQAVWSGARLETR